MVPTSRCPQAISRSPRPAHQRAEASRNTKAPKRISRYGAFVWMRRLDRNRFRCLARLVVRAAWLADVDAALEEGAIFDRDALRDHVAGQRAFAPDVDAVAGIDIAAHLAQHHDFAGRDIRRHLAIAT